jgi:hypothetical protein
MTCVGGSEGAATDAVFEAIIVALRGAARDHPLATLREEFLKVAAAEAAIRAGAVMLEGSNRPGMVNEIAWGNGTLSTYLADFDGSQLGSVGRVGKPAGTTTSDLRLVYPADLSLEIKARCDFGSSRGNASGTLRKDIQRVVDGDVDGLVLLADKAVYRNLRTDDRSDSRGRPRSSADVALFDACFPPLGCSASGLETITTQLGSLSRWHQCIRTAWGSTRKLVLLVHVKSPLVAAADQAMQRPGFAGP